MIDWVLLFQIVGMLVFLLFWVPCAVYLVVYSYILASARANKAGHDILMSDPVMKAAIETQIATQQMEIKRG
jgi:hypothetical protein